MSPEEIENEAACSIERTAAEFSIYFIKYKYDFEASFQFCLLQKCLNICTRVHCVLIEHAEYASFGQSERALYHSYFITAYRNYLQINEIHLEPIA